MKFELIGSELKTFEKWNKEHIKTCKIVNSKFKDATGYRLEFTFSPISIGTGIVVKCACGEGKNCTDVNEW